jgi:hypothetical protein
LFKEAAIPPWAAPLWDRSGWIFEMTPMLATPALAAAIAAQDPAKPAPTMTMSCVMVSDLFISGNLYGFLC